MLKQISHSFLKSLGWTLDNRLPEEDKYVLIVAHHTSNWDFIYGLFAKWALGQRFAWVGKHTLFYGPLKYFFVPLGGIPVDRRASHGFIDHMVDEFERRESMKLAITPEGTRSKVGYWKTGFYYIARKAQVPIALGYIDYKTKAIGIGETFYPTGDIEKDMQSIRKFYSNVSGKRPELEGDIRVHNDR